MIDTLLRPSDADALKAELRLAAAATGLPMMFGGEVDDRVLVLTESVGTRTNALNGLAVRPGSGLGGATMVAERPMSVTDYRRSSRITHDYDGPVAQEGIRSAIAVPVVVSGKLRAVLYGAHRSAAPIGDRTIDTMTGAAGRLSRELAIRDEVDRRVRDRLGQLASYGADVVGAEQVRAVQAELFRLADDPDTDADVCNRLGVLAQHLTLAVTLKSADADAALRSRELDVLTEVALGCTDGEVAERLSLTVPTVKSYLRHAAASLGVRGRYEAVCEARRLRLIA